MFEKLLHEHAPPAARHLKHLWESQMRALKSKSLRTYWHEEILNWCGKIFRKDRGAYELMWSGQVLLLPHPDTVRHRNASQCSRAGHDDDRYGSQRTDSPPALSRSHLSAHAGWVLRLPAAGPLG